jgi:uroporphyrinogen-III synthase
LNHPANGQFLEELLHPAPWPTTFITQDLPADAPLLALFGARRAVLHGASCIAVQPSGSPMPGEAQAGDWMFLGSPKCAELFASQHDLSRYRVATMGEGTRQALPAGTRIDWTGNGRPVEVFEELAGVVGARTVWIPHANRTMRRWEGPLTNARPWHFYDVVIKPLSLPAHELALVLSPSNAEGYVESGGSAPVIAIGDTTADHARRIGLNVVGTATSPQAWGWSAALDRLGN